MAHTGYIYVPAPSRSNLAIGIDRGVWGWRSAALAKGGAREAVRSLRKGDFLILGHKGPNSRVQPGGWAEATLRRVVVAQVTRPLYRDDEPVWPDAAYPERLGIDVLDEEEHVSGVALGAEAMECLRLSANKQGAAVLLPGAAPVARLVAELPPADGSVGHEGQTNAVAQVLVRREQAKLRRRMLGSAEQAACTLCGRVLPVRFIRAAHIKRRADASGAERLLMANVMPVCLLGCDELFEHGHIYVTAEGIVARRTKSGDTPDLDGAVAALVGRSVADSGGHRAPFFAWHRSHVAC
ncbi:hypothetical protein [Streptomyces sp. NBC_00271]|uniref:hypothetical protein n=1 Tax=Streptomyces sp. NBC_00271 TaxID=2975697 RepID=UPI002E2D51F6|nr:hypothetical protein [Streptomyces sp. NBC_00271]